jgi:hypothetical protein
MVKHLAFFALFILFSLTLSASTQIGTDTLKPVKDTTVCKRHTTIKPTTDFDQRFSFIRNYSVNIWGQRGGILLNDEWKFGVGAYYMDDTRMSAQSSSGVVNPNRYVKQNLIFGTAYFEPYLLRRTYWELSVPFELGYGKAGSSVYESSNDELIHARTKDFIPTGAGLSLSLKFPPIGRFKPTSWIGINFLAGYRYCLLENVFKTDYDGAFWSISGALFLDRVFDDVRAWKNKRKGIPNCDPTQ